MRYYVNPEGTFLNSELIPEYSDDIAYFNKKNNTNYRGWSDIPIPYAQESELAKYLLGLSITRGS